MLLLIVLYLVVYAWFATWTGFLVFASVKRIEKAGLDVPFGARLVYWIWLLLGGPGDVLYNAIMGSWIFAEAPQWTRGEFMFSHRVERHAMYGSGWRQREGLKWGLILTAADKEHIDLPKES